MDKRTKLLVETLGEIEYLFDIEAPDRFFFEMGFQLRKKLRKVLTKDEKKAAKQHTKTLKEQSGDLEDDLDC